MVHDQTNCEALLGELDRYEALLDRLSDITARHDAERRLALIRGRSELAQLISRLRTLSEPIFANRADGAQFQQKFAAMRAQIARHQANWPAVLLGERPAEFQASARSLRDANRKFLAWTRDALRVSPGSNL